jgi:hypothetical protein
MSARVLVAATAAALAALFAAPSAFGQLSLASDFDESNEGWQQAFGVFTSTPEISAAPRSATGGNPGGFIRSSEFNSGDPENPIESALVSPASWSGDALSNYGGTVAFDALSNTANPNATPDFPFQVFLFRGTLPLTEPGEAVVNAVVDTENGFTPGTWTRYSIPLVPERWTQGGDLPADENYFRYVLKDLGGVVFSVDAYDGPSGGGLDNPSFAGGSAPSPAVYARTLTISYSARAFRGELSSEGSLANCSRSVAVKVYRKERGPDFKVGQDETSDFGAYEVAARRKPGRYYARVGKHSVSPELGVSCGAARSRVLKID